MNKDSLLFNFYAFTPLSIFKYGVIKWQNYLLVCRHLQPSFAAPVEGFKHPRRLFHSMLSFF